jgi:hypothetical protein
MPAMRRNLQLATGMRATVDLTLSTLADAVTWLPAQRRRPDEPNDEWSWTLRSAANRPILRLVEDGDVVLSPAGPKEASRSIPIAVRASLVGGDGGFGGGGIQNAIELDRAGNDGSDAILRANLAALPEGLGSAAVSEVDAGYQRQLGFAGTSRMVVSYASHPEMASSGGAMGMQVLRMASAEKMRLGDLMELEAGGTIYAIHTSGTVFATQPFLRVTVHPGEVWAVRYSLATSRNAQGFDALDSVAMDLPVTAMSGGRLCTEGGTHQEIAVSRKAGKGLVEAAVYHDAINHSAIAGMGAVNAADLSSQSGPTGVLLDTATGSFRFLGAGYKRNGITLTLSEPLTADLWAALEYEDGAALSARGVTSNSLRQVAEELQPEMAPAATVSLKGDLSRTGTKLRAAYRWQPRHLVTAVGLYDAFNDQAYLSFYVRQAVRWGNRLPPGIEATIEVTNLLAEGYQPFLSADGRTLFLAQTPRTLQAGLSFTF